MMWRLALLLLGVMSALLSTVLVAGRIVTAPAQFAMQSSACQLPCILGMTPGETTRPQAESIANQMSGGRWRSVNGAISFNIADSAGRAVMVALDFNDFDRLISIRLTPRDPGAQLWRLGDLLSEQPTQNIASLRACESTVTRLNLRFDHPSDLEVALMSRGHLSPFDSLLLIDLAIREPRWTPYSARPFGCFFMRGWRGFAPFHQYARFDETH